jgi:hypothetical protein
LPIPVFAECLANFAATPYRVLMQTKLTLASDQHKSDLMRINQAKNLLPDARAFRQVRKAITKAALDFGHTQKAYTRYRSNTAYTTML